MIIHIQNILDLKDDTLVANFISYVRITLHYGYDIR